MASNKTRSGVDHQVPANMLGGNTGVIAVTPTAGTGKGFFAPYRQFELLADVTAPAPAPAPAPKVEEPEAFDPLRRGEFALTDFCIPARPCMSLFFEVAPDTDSARQLFMTYIMDNSEFDTELLEDIMAPRQRAPRHPLERHQRYTDADAAQRVTRSGRPACRC
jgi:hypothetical protein